MERPSPYSFYDFHISNLPLHTPLPILSAFQYEENALKVSQFSVHVAFALFGQRWDLSGRRPRCHIEAQCFGAGSDA